MARRFAWTFGPVNWVALLVLAAAAAAQPAKHPLDPLSFSEHWVVLEVLNDAGHVEDDTRFSIVTLAEPDKATVLAWSDGQPIARTGLAVLRQKDKTFEALVDVVNRKLVSYTERPGVQAPWVGSEFGAVVGKVKQHPDFVAAMKRRGISDLSFVDCSTLPPGYFGTREELNRRIGHVRCVDAAGARNTWGREIEGVVGVVDLNTDEVLRIADEGIAPRSQGADYHAAALGKPREVPGPIFVSQPLGAGFEVDGYEIEWQKWQLHVRPDARVGMVVSRVRYQDGERERPVLYQGHLSEIFVPYMDPAFAWYVRNFLDAGEFSVGGLAKPMLPGADCPPHAIYYDLLVAGEDGRPNTVPNALCVFEREDGSPSWRHLEDGLIESRKRRDLVLRSAATIGNYDYLFDWALKQDGGIEVGVGATGIVESKVVAQANARAQIASAGGAGGGGGASAADAPPSVRADAYGRFVDRNIVAVNHDHYFSYRLDLDVDGPTNRFVADRLVAKTLPKEHPRRSLWVVERGVAQTESEGQLDLHGEHPALWRVESTNASNAMGYATSYQLLPGRNCSTLLSPDDYPYRRAGFIGHHLWVTPYQQGERYAAGDYTTLSLPGEGLPAWTKSNRKVADTDLVLWHTIGMHHVVRAEDWPVMPVMWHSFELRPFDFFDRNPALDLPTR